ncbi:hypothetical protein MROS_0524 [Melioribacter roseus P3M-2]|uniref:Uncharacterized protein n=1 Tax=Melioribacter roseus (strain DSM 23840 / JCM 17771 / VKM B-2668 / P3M-2) TaxID=1191523 RepID=I6YT84_MELRP|nr:hypothetical protein MROS_0524 [Melioribacter roseus P3M-2]
MSGASEANSEKNVVFLRISDEDGTTKNLRLTFDCYSKTIID